MFYLEKEDLNLDTCYIHIGFQKFWRKYSSSKKSTRNLFNFVWKSAWKTFADWIGTQSYE